jgi:hypothetical protein
VFTTGILFTASAAQWTGTISDAKCGAAHADASEKSQGCVKKCVGAGQAAVFVVDGKVYKLDAGAAAKVKDHLGHKVVIDGTLSGDTITVNTVRMPS